MICREKTYLENLYYCKSYVYQLADKFIIGKKIFDYYDYINILNFSTYNFIIKLFKYKTIQQIL